MKPKTARALVFDHDREQPIVDATRSWSAHEFLAVLEPRRSVFGLTGGQFSLIDVVLELLRRAGRSDVVISTWTAAHASIDHAHRLATEDRIASCRWLVDFSFPRRKPVDCALLRARFGDGCLRVTKTHAKFVLIGSTDDVEGHRWRLVVRSSMNLNVNRRLELLEVSDDPRMYAFMLAEVDRWYEQLDEGAVDALPSENVAEFERLTAAIAADEQLEGLGVSLDDPGKAGAELL